jgi:hypothetical protein
VPRERSKGRELSATRTDLSNDWNLQSAKSGMRHYAPWGRLNHTPTTELLTLKEN